MGALQFEQGHHGLTAELKSPKGNTLWQSKDKRKKQQDELINLNEGGAHELCVCAGAEGGNIVSVQLATFDRNVIKKKANKRLKPLGNWGKDFKFTGETDDDEVQTPLEKAQDKMAAKVEEVRQDIKSILIYQRGFRNSQRGDFHALESSNQRVLVLSVLSIIAMFTTTVLQVLTVRTFFVNKSAKSVTEVIDQMFGFKL